MKIDLIDNIIDGMDEARFALMLVAERFPADCKIWLWAGHSEVPGPLRGLTGGPTGGIIVIKAYLPEPYVGLVLTCRAPMTAVEFSSARFANTVADEIMGKALNAIIERDGPDAWPKHWPPHGQHPAPRIVPDETPMEPV